MNPDFKTRLSNFLKRDWIQKDEGKLTYVQLFGFLLIAFGVVYLASYLLPSGVIHAFPALQLDEDPTPDGIAIGFFTTMLGVAFAFPDMLKGQTKEISTMRIIVFMFANVICMLLLKIGWNKDSLQDVGLDGYWMGVIAFLFGAKATQSYFENAKSIAAAKDAPAADDSPLSRVELARLAVNQNRDELMARYPNIESVSDTLKDGNSTATLYLSDHDSTAIPKEVSATLKNGSVIKVPTEVITGSGKGIPHVGQAGDELSDSNSPTYYGSVCCLVSSVTNPDFKGLVTSGHVFTYGDFRDYGGVLRATQRRQALLNGNPSAQLFFQQMKFNQDLAIVELTDQASLRPITFPLTDFTGFRRAISRQLPPTLPSPREEIRCVMPISSTSMCLSRSAISTRPATCETSSSSEIPTTGQRRAPFPAAATRGAASTTRKQAGSSGC